MGRYCAVRRQFADKDAPIIEERKPVETQVLNYSMVQYRLLPIVATAYAFHFTGAAMYKQYEHNMALMKKGDFSLLADTHASSSALKSLSTITAAQAIEDCRRACGGHGYSMASGMASQYADYLPQVTWEGDSYMLTQQTARYLMKIFRKLYMDKNAGKEDDEIPEESPTIEYLQNYLADPQRTATLAYSGDFHNPDFSSRLSASGPPTWFGGSSRSARSSAAPGTPFSSRCTRPRGHMPSTTSSATLQRPSTTTRSSRSSQPSKASCRRSLSCLPATRWTTTS